MKSEKYQQWIDKEWFPNFDLGDTILYGGFEPDFSNSKFNLYIKKKKGFIASFESSRVVVISEHSKRIIDAIAIFESTRVVLIEKIIFKDQTSYE